MHLIPTTRSRDRLIAACPRAVAIAVPVAVVSTTTASAAASLPSAIYAARGTPCKTAHSAIRAETVVNVSPGLSTCRQWRSRSVGPSSAR